MASKVIWLADGSWVEFNGYPDEPKKEQDSE
jgi:hypothetical protein